MATNASDSRSEKINDSVTRGDGETTRLFRSISTDYGSKVIQNRNDKPNLDMSRMGPKSKGMESSQPQLGYSSTYRSESIHGDIVENLSTSLRKLKLEDDHGRNKSGGTSHDVNSSPSQKAGKSENDPVYLTKDVRNKVSEGVIDCKSSSSIIIRDKSSCTSKEDKEKTDKTSNNCNDENDINSSQIISTGGHDRLTEVRDKERGGSPVSSQRNEASPYKNSSGGKYESHNNGQDHDTKVRDKEHGGNRVNSQRNAASSYTNSENELDQSGQYCGKSDIRNNSRSSDKSASRSNSRNCRTGNNLNNKSRSEENTRRSSSSSSDGNSSTRESAKGSKGKGSNSRGADESNSWNNSMSLSRSNTSNETPSSNRNTLKTTSSTSSIRSSNQNTNNSSTSTANAELSRNVNRGALNRDEEQSKGKFESNFNANYKKDTSSSQNSISSEKQEKEGEEEEEEIGKEEEKIGDECSTKSSSDTTKSFTDQQSRGWSNGAGTSSSNEEYSERPTVPENNHIQYKWQYKDYHGWTNYAQVSLSMNHSGARTATSNDIEQYYRTDVEKCPLLVEINNVQFILNFQNMTQTNQKTKSQRLIRRINMNDTVDTSARWPVNAFNASGDAYQSASNNRTSDRRDNYNQQRSSNMSLNHSSVKFKWQFEDEFGKWITYGQSNSYTGAQEPTSSDDIEKVFSMNFSQPIMQIQSNHRQYILNFQNMTQTNEVTKVQRRVRRVPRQSTEREGLVNSVKDFIGDLIRPARELSQFEWQFQDEHGAWITYGQTNSAGMSHCTTTVTSDDIEKYVNSPPKKLIMTIRSRSNRYVLNFTEMIQINKVTSVQRPIRRIPKVVTANKPRYNVDPSSGPTAKFNTASSGPSPAASESAGGSVTKSTLRPVRESHNNNYGHWASNIFHGHVNHTGNSAGNVPHVWQFQDERGVWITYGQFSTTGKSSGSTTASSADIEKHWRKFDGNQPMKVNSSRGVYLIDFKNMVQMHTGTGTKKIIRRIPIQ